MCERDTLNLVRTDLTSHNPGHLSIVAIEHILQAQPESGGKVKHTQKTKWHRATKSNYSTFSFFYKEKKKKHHLMLKSLLVKLLYTDGCRMWDAGLLAILLAGVEDTDCTQQLIQVTWGRVIFTLREGTEVQIMIALQGCGNLLCSVLNDYAVNSRAQSMNVYFSLAFHYYTSTVISVFIFANTSHEVVFTQNKVKKLGWRFLQLHDKMLARGQKQVSVKAAF